MPAPSINDIELAFYERFFFSKGLEPYAVQEQAFGHIFAGDSVLVTVPTGTGKTMMAKAAIYKALERGERAIYTTPLRALTEEKYRELADDFGDANVGFATGDFKVNREAPIQVEVAEILWNRIFGDRTVAPADVVVMDEGHYFNDPERGYVWEQSIIGLDPRAQLVILSATVGHPDRFCHWVELTRRLPMQLVDSRERRVPLHHEFREAYLIDVVKDLAHGGDVPAIVFVFGRELCFEVARLLKSCRRFTSDDERARIEMLCDETLLDGGVAKELRALLAHGIGIHHAGVLPRYKQLVEQLALERLIKFVVCTETIAAGINLPAKTVVFPSLRKYIKREARLVTPAEFHQMSGRAGRPQFDSEGLAIALAPEEVVQEIRKEIKDEGKRGRTVDEAKIRKSVYARARASAQQKGDIVWTPEMHADLVRGEPAELRSRTKITAEQVLAIGLPDLTETSLDPAAQAAAAQAASEPAYLHLDISTVVDNLLLEERERRVQKKQLTMLVDNMRALGVIDEHGKQVKGEMIGKLQGIDGLFVYYVLMSEQLEYEDSRALIEFLVDHDGIQRILQRRLDDVKRDWIKAKLREMRYENAQASWEDAEAEYDRAHPRVLSHIEEIFQRFSGEVPHPELHGGKVQKAIWASMEEQHLGFMQYIEKESLAHEEGSLFSYLVRVMNFGRQLHEATGLSRFEEIAERVRGCIAAVDRRMED